MSNSIKRVNFCVKYSDISAIQSATAELELAVQSGAISSDNILYKFFSNPENINRIASIEPSAELTEEELVGFNSFSEAAQERIKNALNKYVSAGNFVNRETISRIVAKATESDDVVWNNLEPKDQTSREKAAAAWITINTSVDGTSIFVSKKGRGNGTSLRVPV